MPHIDEGTLHALLDGALRAMDPGHADVVEAHLGACAECRARAEEAAALTGSVAEILGVLEPAVAPDFEEVVVRAGSRTSRARIRRQLGWTRGLAWAATLVIALGTGYLIRDRLVPDPAATSTMRQSAPDRTRGSADRQVDESQESTRRSVTGERAESGARSAVANAPPPPAATDRLATPAEQQATSPGSVRERESAAARERAEPLALSGAAAAPPAVADEAEDVPEPLIDIAAAPAEAVKAYQARVGAEGLAAESADGATAFDSIAPDAVAAVIGAPLLVLPGAAVIQTLVSGEGAASTVVSLQRLQEGVEIRVTQRPARVALESVVVTGRQAEESAEAPARPAPSPAAGRSALRESAAAEPPLGMALADRPLPAVTTARVPAGLIGWELLLEGPLPREALETLGAAARPYQAPR